MRSLLDQMLESASARIIGENHDLGSISLGPVDMDAEIRRLVPGTWDASEYGISREEVERRIRAADTPEAREKIMADLRTRAIRRASLDTSNGRVAMFAAGELPWHGLGVLVDRAASAAQAIELAGLNWQVTKEQLGTNINGVWRPVKDTYSITRADTGAHLGTVGSRYAPIQNADGFGFLDGVLAEFGAKFETAGAIFGGKKVWMLAHLPEQAFTLPGNDQCEPYVLFQNSHDGTGAATCYPTSVRVVCANTFRVAGNARGTKGLNIRHTGKVADKIEAAREALGIAVNGFSEYKTAAERMESTPCEIRHYANDVLDAVLEVTQAQATLGADALASAIAVTQAQYDLAFKSFERKIERRGEILDDILERYESERCGLNGMRGTMWAGFNAITEHADHAKAGKQSADRETRLSRRFESVIDGPADDMKQAAYALATR